MPAATDRAVADIAEHYVERHARLDPVAATLEGIADHDTEMTDYSPDGPRSGPSTTGPRCRALRRGRRRRPSGAGRGGDDARPARDQRRALRARRAPPRPERPRVARCRASARSSTRCRPTPSTTGRRSRRASGSCREGLSSLQAAYDEGVAQGLVAARRQVVGCVQQAEVWSGTDDAGDHAVLPERWSTGSTRRASTRPSLRATLAERAERRDRGVRLVRAATSSRSTRRTRPSTTRSARERYAVWARVFNGTELDLDETYAWGWDELHRIEHAMRAVGERILPGEPLADGDRAPRVRPRARDRGRGQPAGVAAEPHGHARSPSSTASHFDIPDPVKRVEAMIAPPGGAAAMYYTGPSEDFSRPGRTWYPTLGKTRFPLWGEVSICYHEGVPGHHLQVAQVRYLADQLNRYQRTLGWVSGHGEGWALYAERLMGELGYLDNPDYELGMLRAQAMRAVRVVVDIGMHLELPIPDDERYHPGETWTPELALPFVIERSMFPEDFMRSEVDRYLGLPGPGDLVQGRRAGVARVPRRRQAPPRRPTSTSRPGTSSASTSAAWASTSSSAELARF